MTEIVITEKQCCRCLTRWYPRKPGRPMLCPNKHCRSPYWDVPKKEKKDVRNELCQGKDG